jgi:hypothetical protein
MGRRWIVAFGDERTGLHIAGSADVLVRLVSRARKCGRGRPRSRGLRARISVGWNRQRLDNPEVVCSMKNSWSGWVDQMVGPSEKYTIDRKGCGVIHCKT